MYRRVRLCVGVLAVALFFPPGAVAAGAQTDDGPHRTIEPKKGRYRIQSDDGWIDLPDVSAHCLECHETAGSAEDEPPGASQRTNSFHSGGGRSHPVDVDYPSNRKGYRLPDELDQRLMLIDRRMTCLTCHAPSVDRSLVLPTARGTLCMACHVK